MGKVISSYNNTAFKSYRSKLHLFQYKLALEGREEFTAEEFRHFKNSDELAKSLAYRKWKDEEIHAIGNDRIVLFCCDLWDMNEELFMKLEDEYLANFEKIFPKKEYKELKKVKTCFYCGISEEEISLLAQKDKLFNDHFRSRKLKIRRINRNLEYTPDNCVKSCYWCQKAKKYEFTGEEFPEVAKSISAIWKKRLNEISKISCLTSISQ